MSQSTSESTSGNVVFGSTDGAGSSFKIVAVIVAAALLAFLIFRKTK